VVVVVVEVLMGFFGFFFSSLAIQMGDQDSDLFLSCMHGDWGVGINQIVCHLIALDTEQKDHIHHHHHHLSLSLFIYIYIYNSICLVVNQQSAMHKHIDR
jgi:hypothetical protein